MGLVALGPSGPHRCRTSRRDGRCNRALLRPRTDVNDSLQCRVVRRVDVGCQRGGRAWSFSLVGVAADGPTPPFCFGLAHRAFRWPLLDVEKPSFRRAELPPPGAEFAPHLGCVVLGSSTALASFAAALSLPQRSGLLEGNK